MNVREAYRSIEKTHDREMGGTSGQSFVEYPAGLMLEQKGANNIQVGEKRQEESSHRYAACDNKRSHWLSSVLLQASSKRGLTSQKK